MFGAVVGVLSENSHINLETNIISDTNSYVQDINVIYLNRSVSTQKNNNFSDTNRYVYFAQKNAKSFISVETIPISGQYIDVLNNSICNFIDLSYNCNFADTYVHGSLHEKEMQDFYIEAQTWMHNAQAISIMSPMFINNGQNTSFSGNENQQLLSNIDILIQDYSETEIAKIQTFLDNFPKNLNGYVLNIIFGENTNTNTNNVLSELSFNNFDAGVLKLFSQNKQNSISSLLSGLTIDNCSIVEIDNISFQDTTLNIKNCNNIIFNNIKYQQSSSSSFNVQSSNVLVKNSKIYLTDDEHYFGNATLNSKVYIHQTCQTYDVNKQLIVDKNIKKFNVTKNSQVTWFTYTDDINRLMNQQDKQFQDNIGIIGSNSFKNHIHASFALQDVVSNIDEFNSIISSMPVGSTFYWPRAFRFSEYTENESNLIQFNWENTIASGINEYAKYMKTYSPELQNYNDIYTNGEIITLSDTKTFKVTPLIPFVYGAIPLALHSQNGWDNQFENLENNLSSGYVSNLSGLFVNTNNLSASTATINTCYPSHKYKSHFYYTSLYQSYWDQNTRLNKSIQSKADNFLNLAYLIQHPSGPSERTNRSDQFGGLSMQNYSQLKTLDINTSCITLRIGCTHNMGGNVQTPFNVNSNVDGGSTLSGLQYYRHTPPHSEYWYARQGIHLVFQVGSIIQKDQNTKQLRIPAYLQNGYLKFSYNFTPPLNNKKQWYGIFMVSDDYRILKNNQSFQEQCACSNWPAFRNQTQISFLKPGETNVQKNAGKHVHSFITNETQTILGQTVPNLTKPVQTSKEDPLLRMDMGRNPYTGRGSLWANKTNYFNDNSLSALYQVRDLISGDYNDVPIYGNYFLSSNGDIYLPINKIAGKYLTFGIRGTYSTNLFELDNNRYTGKYADPNNPGSIITDHQVEAQNTAVIQFYDFRLIPGIMPNVFNNKIQLADRQSFPLKFNEYHFDNDNNINAPIGSDNSLIERDMWRQGGRYYANINFDTNISYNQLPLSADFEISGRIFDFAQDCYNFYKNTYFALKDSTTDKKDKTKNFYTTTINAAKKQGQKYRDNFINAYNLQSNKQIGLAVFDKIVSDTILCVKTSENISIAHQNVDRSIPQMSQEINFWYLNELSNNNINNFLFYTNVKYKDSWNYYNTLQNSDYKCLQDNAIAVACKSSISDITNTTPNSYFISGSPAGTKMGIFNYSNSNGYNFIPSASFKSTQYIGLVCSPAFMFNISGTTNEIQQPNQPISIYNYYWKQNIGEQIGTLLQNTGIYYLWNGIYKDNGNDSSLIGFKPMPNKNELSGQWYYHFGLSKYKIAKSLLTFLTVITDSINALPTYFYSPVQDRLQFKYNMGVIGNNVTGAVLPEYDFDMFNEIQDGTLTVTNPQQLSGYLISADLNLNWYSYVSAGIDAFGVYDQHIGLRRSKGLAWPLYDVTDISGYVLNELNEKVYDYIPSTLNRYNFDKIFFELPDGISEISSATPELFNIKLITTNLDTNKFTYLTIDQTTYPVSGMYDKITYPSILSSKFILEEQLLHGQNYNTILQDLDDLNMTNIYVFNVNKFFNTIISAYNNNQEQKVSLTKATTITFNENIDTAIGIINGTNLSNSTIEFKNNMILNNPSVTDLTDMLSGNSGLLSEKPFVVCTTQIPGGNGSNVSGVVKQLDNDSFTIYYGKLSYVAGSLAEEYREKNKNNITVESTSNTVSLKYDYTYTFENFADILLFYINAKSYINYFMIKFNKLFNHITNYNYNTNTNELTISSFNDTFENPDNYVNAYTAYTLASYSNLNDTAIWKAFAYNDLYSEVTGNFNYNRNLLYNYPVVSPYNTMAWTNSKNHSKVLGQHYPINSENIYEYNTGLFDWFNKYLVAEEWKEISGDATVRKQQAYNYTISSEHMMSFYRPFYLEFKNMFNSIDWSMGKLDDLEYNEVPQSKTFTSKCFNGGFINISKLMYSENTKKYQEVIGKCINYNAFNKDYGWFDNNFTFDSIIQPDLDNLQYIALNNTKLSSTLSAGLLQPSLTKQQIYGLNQKILTTTLVLDLANNNDNQYILSSNMITVLSGHLYKNGVLGIVYYQNDMGNDVDHTEIYNGTTSEYLTLTGPSANISYSTKNKHLIQYSFFDKLQFNNIPNYTTEIHLSQIISDISNNSIFASNLNLQNIKEITLSKSTTNASYAFNGISSMINIPTSLIIPDTCTDMQYMFNDCIGLTNLNNFNLGISISSANGIFKGCESITKLRTNNTQFLIPENVVTTNQLFEGCKKLYIQQNQFNIETNILSSCNRMFKDCFELDKIPFTLPTSVINCSGMFENDEKIPLIPEGFTFHDGLINTNSMFKNCDSISSIPIWFSQTTTIKDIGSMFEGMHNIFKLDNTYTLPTSVINAENLFRDCANIVDLNVNSFLTGMLDIDNQYNKDIRLSGMFAECSILTGTISNELISALIELPSAQVLGMFAKCVNLTNYIEMPYILTLEENN